MANTYTQLHIHVVFSVQNRASLIRRSFKKDLYKYITGIIQNNGHKLLAINGTSDHIHILIGLKPNQSLSNLMQDIKGDSSKWINKNGFTIERFRWQEGYGAFSYSKSQVNNVINYIKNQETHHHRKSFIEEYNEFLKEFEIPFDERYIFKPV